MWKRNLNFLLTLAPGFFVLGIFDYRFHSYYWSPLNLMRPLHPPPQFDFFSIWEAYVLLLALFFAAGLLLKKITIPWKKIPRLWITTAVFTVMGVITSAIAFAPTEPVIHSFFGNIFPQYIIPLLFSFILLASVHEKESREKFIRVLLATFTIFGALTIFEFATNALPGANRDFLGRLVWPYIDPFVGMKPESANWMAYLFGPLVLLSLSRILAKKPGTKNRLIFFAFGVSAAILILTKSYAGIGVAFGLAAYLILIRLPKKWKALAAAVLILMLAIGISSQYKTRKFQILLGNYKKENSLQRRAQIYSFTWQTAKEKPFIGIGPGNYQSYFRANMGRFNINIPEEELPPHPHNLGAQFWSDLGIAGFLAILLLYAIIAVRLLQNPLQNLSAFPLAYFLGHGLADSAYGLPEIAALFWILLWYHVTQRHDASNN